jgi:hypothetical protein
VVPGFMTDFHVSTIELFRLKPAKNACFCRVSGGTIPVFEDPEGLRGLQGLPVHARKT